MTETIWRPVDEAPDDGGRGSAVTTFSAAEIPCAGPVSPIWQLCSRCHGIAAISAIYYTPTGAVIGRMPCDACKGSKRQQCTIADAE